MGNEEDIQRLRTDINDLYIQAREVRERLTRLEERSDNRDEKIEELKKAIAKLEEEIGAKLDSLAAQVQTLVNAPAQKVAGRWEKVAEAVMLLFVGALGAYVLGKVGL